MGACSVSEDDFLNKVKGKVTYDEIEAIGSFSEDGRTYNETYKFQKTTDENTGIYISKTSDQGNVEFTFTTSDGKTMKYVSKQDGSENDRGSMTLKTE